MCQKETSGVGTCSGTCEHKPDDDDDDDDGDDDDDDDDDDYDVEW